MPILCTSSPAASGASNSTSAAAARRCLLRCAGAAVLLALCPNSLVARLRVRRLWTGPRQLWVTRPQAQESVRAVYWADSHLQVEGYAALNHIYRDLHADEQRPIALGLLDLNYVMQNAIALTHAPCPLVLLSGYRTAETNRLVGGELPNIHGAGLADDYFFAGLTLPQNYRIAYSQAISDRGPWSVPRAWLNARGHWATALLGDTRALSRALVRQSSVSGARCRPGRLGGASAQGSAAAGCLPARAHRRIQWRRHAPGTGHQR